MILVFGGAGQLGQELTRAAAAAKIPLIAAKREHADVADAAEVAAVIARCRPTLVVNAAAYTNVDLAESEPEAAYGVNVRGAAVVAEACARADLPLVHLSTDFVFDGQKVGAYVEIDPVAPLGVYGRTKADGEAAVRERAARHIILRTSWLYGVFGRNFVKTMLRLALERDELRVVADQHGSPTSTRDLARAVLAVAPRLVEGGTFWGTYHFAGAGVTSWHGFADAVVAAAQPFTRRRPKVTAITTAEYSAAARRPPNSRLDCGLFERTFGVRPRPWRDETRLVVEALLGRSA